MREASVLYTATVEVLIRLLFQSNSYFLRFEYHRSSFINDTGICSQIDDLHQPCLFIQFDPDFSGSQCYNAVLFIYCQIGYLTTRLVYKYLCLRFCFRVTDDSSRIILKYTEDILSVKINCPPLIIGE